MPFVSLSYFLFLPVVFVAHYIAPDRFRWLVLLVASFCFYAALKVPYLIVVLAFTTTITYFMGILIDQQEDPRTKQYLLWGGIIINVLILVLLKYLPFISKNLNFILNLISPGTTVSVCGTIIAIGTSYFIFQAISYLIDIYLEIIRPERHFGHFALYMSFFPKLLQGPIERAGDLLHQLKLPYVFNYDNVRSGLLLFALGLMKKIIIADRLALMINPIFANVHAYKGSSLLLATYYYSLQIYFDFSGYTDMALATALMFNVTLTQNFLRPYFATSIADFWRRWHISFSRWILDYIFKPLQILWRGHGNWGTALSLLITFAISGIWHGASWGFVLWGLLHGMYMAISIPYKTIKKRFLNYFKISAKSVIIRLFDMLVVFNLVSIAWIFFRTESVSDALYVLYYGFMNSFVNLDWASIKTVSHVNLALGKEIYELYILCTYIIFIAVSYNCRCVAKIQSNSNTVLRWLYYTFIISSIMLFGCFGNNEFIYSNF